MTAAESQPIISVCELSTRYGSRPILSSINLNVKHREIMVIMGRSGSGKTTLFRHILGLLPYREGSIRVLGNEITTLSRQELLELRMRTGVAFQNGALFSSLSTIENVELPLHQHTRLDKSTIRIMARLKLELMDLGEHEDLMPAELSGGMLKRAGLARAVVMDPQLLFFDEPSAGLDPVTSVELDELILQLRDTFNMTIVVVTHELESAFKIADRITILDQGHQIITGNKETIFNSEDRRVINLLQRRAGNNDINADDYLKQLTRD